MNITVYSGPKCPYCGYAHDPGDEPNFYYNEELTEMDCDSCGKPFMVDVHVSWSWTSKPYAVVTNQTQEASHE